MTGDTGTRALADGRPGHRLVRREDFAFTDPYPGRGNGFEEHVLDPGDSIAFDSSIPHRLHNDGDEVVTAIWMVLGRHHHVSEH